MINNLLILNQLLDKQFVINADQKVTFLKIRTPKFKSIGFGWLDWVA